MSSNPTNHWTRRHFLLSQALSLGPVALAWLLDQTGGRAEPAKPELEHPTYDLKPKAPPRPPRARAMISLFMQGGPSHLDLFDPKPELTKRDGKTLHRATSSSTTPARPAPSCSPAPGSSTSTASAAWS